MPLLSLGPDTELYFDRIEGADSRPVLVFLHEGLGCTAMWKDFPARLCAATGCEGLVYDRLGYGLSSPLRRRRSIHYLHEFALTELPAVLEALLSGREYLLVGHSDGGSIALIHAAARPQGLRAVVTGAAHVFVEDITLQGIRAAKAAYAEGKLRGLQRYHGDKTDAVFAAWADTWLDPAFAHWNIEYLLPAMDCPVLALQGARDQYGSAAQLDAIAGQAANARQAVLPDCGHSPHAEAAEATLEAMLGFILRNT
ncbi:alpha/beta fold hydrolase [Massilia endophytica]|uniref:alpha/beta fold hydrolase n=1 Tax=Massilia endophytica TaxID=2899220 RepID=UPI001E56CB0F|nr:alpha/beta fold hydrolase [Massilia endophytica]UGQ44840.1 alpha/beta hydrolase [Massilia endophytica]